MSKSPWGFTNADNDFELVKKWRDDAIADGWAMKSTYLHEPIESACTLTKDGWVALIFLRTKENNKKWKYEVDVSVWGPDGLTIDPLPIYSFESLSKQLKKCFTCNTEGVDTFRVGFCNRVCAKCLPEQRKKLEVPGWCD